MSDLLSLLHLGAGGIAAANVGVSVASNNVANVNTDGYSRQRVDLEAQQGTNLLGGGVRANDPQRTASDMLAFRIRTTGGSLAMAKAFAEALSDVELRLTGSGDTLDEQITKVFSRLSQVAAMPTNVNMRDAVIAAARDLVSGIRRRAADAEAAQRESNARIADLVERARSLAKELAATNKAIATSPDPVLKDQRDELARQLSELVGGQARIDPDGQMRFVLDGGAVLVDGVHPAALEATPDPVTGMFQLAVVDGASRRDVTGDIAGGQVGAELTFRDTTIAGVRTQLDQLAYDVVTSFNAVHTANAGLDGVTGRVMFTPLGGVAGAAQAIALDPALLADPRRLATAAPGPALATTRARSRCSASPPRRSRPAARARSETPRSTSSPASRCRARTPRPRSRATPWSRTTSPACGTRCRGSTCRRSSRTSPGSSTTPRP